MAWLSFFPPFCQASAYILLLLISVILSSLSNPVLSQCANPPVIFNFGDSNSDTGGLVAGLGYPINLPNGRTFFRRSTGRLSDGRLILDFLCKSFPDCSKRMTFFFLKNKLNFNFSQACLSTTWLFWYI